MKIVVMSDSHGRDDAVEQVINRHFDADLFIHCGDLSSPIENYPGMIAVKGNNDYYSDLPYERIVTLEGHRILITHAHLYGYYGRERRLAAKARESDCDIVLYGHTHVARREEVDGVTLINPGSLYYCRDGRGQMYAVLKLKGQICEVRFHSLQEEMQ